MSKLSSALGASLLAGLFAAACSSSSSETPDNRAKARSYARDDLACTTVDDCCVVFDDCRADGLIVAAKDKDTVASLLASAPQDACLKCIAPAIDVRCSAGKCSAVEMQPPATGGTDVPAARQDHCGAITFPAGWSEKPQTLPGDYPGLSPELVIGCG